MGESIGAPVMRPLGPSGPSIPGGRPLELSNGGPAGESTGVLGGGGGTALGGRDCALAGGGTALG